MYGSIEQALQKISRHNTSQQDNIEQLIRALHADDPRLLAYMTALVKAVHLITE